MIRMVSNCKSCGKIIVERKLRFVGYCRECAVKARDEGFGKILKKELKLLII